MKYSNSRVSPRKTTNRHITHKDKFLQIFYLSLIRSTFWHKKTGCITRIHPVFELLQARGEVVINVLFVNTGTVYVTLIFRFVVNANTFSFVTIVVTTRDTIDAEVVKTNVL